MTDAAKLIQWNRKLAEETIAILEDSEAKTQDAISRLRDFLKVNPGGPTVQAASCRTTGLE